MLSHPEQLDRLATACPEAVPTAVLAGDPCYDRILEALPDRDRFRRALGVGPGQRLIVLNSTWSPRSLFGDSTDDSFDDLLPWLLPRLTGELPADEYRVAAVLHPNIWYGHGEGQLRGWLARARAAGLTPVPPLEGWRQALIAADCVIGDHSSVTFYAAALGTPVLLGAFPAGDLDPDSPVAALGRTAPHLVPGKDLRTQLDRAVHEHEPKRYAALAAQTSSDPLRSAALLRRLFYRLIGLPEPADRPALLTRLAVPAYAPAERTAPVRVLTRILGTHPPTVRVTRYCDPPYEPEEADADSAHTAVAEDTPDPARPALADVIVRTAAEDDPRLGPPRSWAAEVLARHPGCALAAYLTAPGRCYIGTREGVAARLAAAPDPDGRPSTADPAALASAVYAWLAAGHPLPAELVVRTGPITHRVAVTPQSPAPASPPAPAL
ncbi:hypothetical protein [Streptomyces sp. NPDC089919]|uniref:hypothetical protein n=1 Tax=Streptomyces sp. NPDC089919 TaxID=3155188 RepID=UPI00342B9A08